ncbi:MAG: Rab family GTPase [Candidatus Kariarchaeaceae archaeon]
MEEKTIASDYIFKIIAVGNASVGKTSLTLRFATDNFQDDYKMTLGMNLVTKNVQLNSYSIQLAIWDTGGQDSFAPLLPMYYRGALGALVVYDLTNEKSFQSVQKWMNDIKRYCDEIPVVLIGNKKDLVNQTIISTDEGENLAIQLKESWSKPIHFREASAKEDLEVDASFQDLAESILEIVEAEEEEEEEESPIFSETD